MAKTRKVGWDAGNGQFIPVREAERRKRTAVVETIKVPKPAPRRAKVRASELSGGPAGSPPFQERLVMASGEFAPEVQHVIHISTDIGKACEQCHTSVGLERFAESINHYIEEHGYRLLHVGQQTESGSEGPYQTTVAVVGRSWR